MKGAGIFIYMLGAQKDPPCDQYNCKYKLCCNTLKYACRAFSSYVNEDIVRQPTEPTKAIYDRIFRDE